MDLYSSYIHKSRYARYRPEEGRRETWEETVRRYITFFIERYSPEEIPYDEIHAVENAILNMDVMPSMRCMMTAGPALERDNVAGYNCSYLPIDDPRALDEMMYILMCGTGVGFSVERQYIDQLPEVPEELHETDTVITVPDSKIGWAKSFRELVSLLYAGHIPRWDLGRVRPSGTPLRTFGGRASGPEPLAELFRFTVELFRTAVRRRQSGDNLRLTSLDVHDLCCKIAEVVVVGGVRRSALISLSNLTDDRMRRAKHGDWWTNNGQRRLSNNSVCYTVKPDFESFLEEWRALYESKSGERGIFSRPASVRQAGASGRRDTEHSFGTNPCSEIILRPYQFCNLSEVVVRPDDTIDDLKRKVRFATILGTLQATLTDFRYLRNIWKKNTEEERLLGVSLTGIMDHQILNGSSEPYGWGEYHCLEDILEELKDIAVETNKEWSSYLGIPVSTAITCVKPSGTVSQLVGSASGIHPRYSQYYIRNVRAAVSDPISDVLKAAGVPWAQDGRDKRTLVFSFPTASPVGSITADSLPAMDQLRLWKVYQDYWCEHKPSMTCYYRPEDFLEVGQWVYNNFDSVSGIAFLEYDGHTYSQAPIEPITEEKYNELIKDFPKEINWDVHEEEDNTTASQELACLGSSCEIK